MRTLFVPTDFSDASLVALKYAVEIAHAADARMVLYSVVHVPPPVAELGAVTAVPDAEALVEDTRKALEGLALELAVHTTQDLEIQVEVGLATDQIRSWMSTHRPWLTIMASKGATGLERFVWGSVTREVAEHAPTPVLILPETYAYEPINKILYATDFRTSDRAVTTYLTDWVAEAQNLSIHYVHVANGAVPMTFEEEHMGKFQADLAHLSPAPQTTFEMKSGRHVDRVIQQEIETGEWHMLVVCPQHRSWLIRLFAPSVSNQLVEQLDLPILVHPGNSREDLN